MNTDVLLRPWYKEPWPWILMLGPGIVIIAGFVTFWIALTTSDGMVEDDYYKQGLAINQRIHRDHAARDLGLEAEVMRSGPMIRVFLNSAKGAELPTQLSFRLMHPTQDGHDQTIVLSNQGHGFYGGELMSGVENSARWNVFIEDQDSTWRLMGTWKTASEEPLKLVPQH